MPRCLGDTIGEIAADKAGHNQAWQHSAVIAPQSDRRRWHPILEACNRVERQSTVLIGRDVTWESRTPVPQTQESRGREAIPVAHRPWTRLGSYDLDIPLLGDYQMENAATAVDCGLEAFNQQGAGIRHKTPKAVELGDFAKRVLAVPDGNYWRDDAARNRRRGPQ